MYFLFFLKSHNIFFFYRGAKAMQQKIDKPSYSNSVTVQWFGYFEILLRLATKTKPVINMEYGFQDEKMHSNTVSTSLKHGKIPGHTNCKKYKVEKHFIHLRKT